MTISLVISGFPFGNVFFVKMDYKWDREEERAHIRYRLRSLYSYAVKGEGEEKDGRQEEDALTAACEERGDRLEAETLIKLIDEGTERHKGYADREKIKSLGAYGNDLSIIAEEPHYLLGEQCRKRRKENTDSGTDLDGEGEAFPGALFVARAVVVARGGLKSLTETDDDVAESAVVSVGNACEKDPARVDRKLVALLEMVIYHSREKIVSRGDSVEVAREMKVDVLHRNSLSVSAACRTALNTKYRTKRRLSECHSNLFAYSVHSVCKSYCGRGFTLARRSRVYSCN